MDDAQLDQLAQMLKRGPEAFGCPTVLWTIERVRRLIGEEFGVSLGHSRVWTVLRKKLGWSCQRPAKRARERDEEAIMRWKRYVWPHLRRSLNPRGRLSEPSATQADWTSPWCRIPRQQPARDRHQRMPEGKQNMGVWFLSGFYPIAHLLAASRKNIRASRLRLIRASTRR